MAYLHAKDCRALNPNPIDGPAAPCLVCGECPWCCEDVRALRAKLPPKAKARAWRELWQCPKCGIKAEFEIGHAMVGCTPVAEGRP